MRTIRGLQSLVSPAGPQSLKIALLIPALLFVAIGYAQTTIPDTPAGRTLRAWLDAFNSSDRAKIEAYIKTFEPQQSVERMMGFHDQSGFDLLAIEVSEPLLIKVSRNAGATHNGYIYSLGGAVAAGPTDSPAINYLHVGP